MTIGENIQARRKAARLTQKQLGLNLGYSEKSAERIIQFWEHGDRRPDVTELRPLCHALHCTLEELIPRE